MKQRFLATFLALSLLMPFSMCFLVPKAQAVAVVDDLTIITAAYLSASGVAFKNSANIDTNQMALAVEKMMDDYSFTRGYSTRQECFNGVTVTKLSSDALFYPKASLDNLYSFASWVKATADKAGATPTLPYKIYSQQLAYMDGVGFWPAFVGYAQFSPACVTADQLGFHLFAGDTKKIGDHVFFLRANGDTGLSLFVDGKQNAGLGSSAALPLHTACLIGVSADNKFDSDFVSPDSKGIYTVYGKYRTLYGTGIFPESTNTVDVQAYSSAITVPQSLAVPAPVAVADGKGVSVQVGNQNADTLATLLNGIFQAVTDGTITVSKVSTIDVPTTSTGTVNPPVAQQGEYTGVLGSILGALQGIKDLVISIPSTLTDIKDKIISIPSAISDSIAKTWTSAKEWVVSLVVPKEAVITSFKNKLNEKLPFVPQLQGFATDFKSTLENPSLSASKLTLTPLVDLGKKQGGQYGNAVINFLDFTWYVNNYKSTVDQVIIGFFWCLFLWNLYGQIPSIINGGQGYLVAYEHSLEARSDKGLGRSRNK